MKITQIKIKRNTTFKLLNSLPLNSLPNDYCWGLAIREISVNEAINLLKKNKFSSYIRHAPLVDYLSKKINKKLKPVFSEAKFEDDDIFICLVLSNRTKVSGQDSKVNEKNLRVFVVSRPFNDLEGELEQLNKIINSNSKK